MYSGDFALPKVRAIKSSVFHGIDRSKDPGDLPVAPECWTDKCVNANIVNGNIEVRHNYAAVTTTIDLGDGYAYVILEQHVHAPTAGGRWWLASCEALSAGVHHHYCLLHRKFDRSTAWAEVKSAGSGSHGFGSAGDSVWPAAPVDSFQSFSGDFLENKTELFATQMSTGSDPLMFYMQTGSGNNCLCVLGSNGFKAASVVPATDVFTCAGLTLTNGDLVEFYSSTQQMCAGISAWTPYYVVNQSGSTFKLSLTAGGAAVDITSTGANLAARLVKDYGDWKGCTAVQATGVFTAASGHTPAANQAVMFQAATGGALPRGILSTRLYYQRDVAGQAFKVSDSATAGVADAAISLLSAGSNFQVRYVKANPADAPRGASMMMKDNRDFVFMGDNVYHNAGFYADPKAPDYDGRARPNDWTTAILAGNFPLQEWLGDRLQVMKSLNGMPLIYKKAALYTIDGVEPPYRIRRLYNAVGTIAPKSVCAHPIYGAFHATTEGVVRFNGQSTEPFLVREIQGIWHPDNAACRAAVWGDRLIVYGNFYHPETGVKGKGLLVCDLPTHNVMYWTTALGEATLTVDSILDPFFTTLDATASGFPELWFASGSTVYKYSLTAPAAGAAVPRTYWIPSKDYGSAGRRKNLSQLTVTGSGGTDSVTPYADGVAKTAKTFELPARPKPVTAFGYRLGYKLASTDDPVIVQDFEQEMT